MSLQAAVSAWGRAWPGRSCSCCSPASCRGTACCPHPASAPLPWTPRLPLPSPHGRPPRRCAQCPGCRGADRRGLGCVTHSQGTGVGVRTGWMDRHAGPHRALCCGHHGLCVPGQGASSGHHRGWGDPPPPRPRGPSQPSSLLQLPGPTAQGRAGSPSALPPDPGRCCCLCLHQGPCQPSGNPSTGATTPHSHRHLGLPAAPSPMLPSPLALTRFPSKATCQAQGCHLPELGVQGDSRGYWAPWQRPSRGQPRTSVSGLLCTVPGPGPTGTSADPTLFSGLLGALWTVGQSRESRCPEWVSQAGVGRVVGVCREACSQSSCPTIPQDPPHKPALGLSVETTR